MDRFLVKTYETLSEMSEIKNKMLKCRLCSTLGEYGIMAFSDEGLIRCLPQHIKKYLYITVTMDDKLTKFICTQCLNILEKFHSFALMAWQSQKQLINALKSTQEPLEVNNPNLKLVTNLTNLTKQETVQQDHDYATCVALPALVIKESELPTKLSSKTKKKNKTKKKMVEIKPKVQSDEVLTTIKAEIDDNYRQMIINNNNDSNTHETLEIVIDPSLYLESSCESLNNSDLKPCVMCFNFNTENNNNNNNESEQIDIKEEIMDDLDVNDVNMVCEHGEMHCDCVFVCPICGKANFSKHNLKLHLRIHRPKGKYECDICKRIFKSNSNLDQHKNYHMKVKHQCDVCKRVYPTQSTLKAHYITHSNLRPHHCTICEKSFKRNQDLKFHMNQHTGARPYKCLYCPKAFASSGNCFSHRKRMHPDEVERDRNYAAKILR